MLEISIPTTRSASPVRLERHLFDVEPHRAVCEDVFRQLREIIAKGSAVRYSELAVAATAAEWALTYVSVFAREDPIQLGAARTMAQGRAALLQLSNSPPGHVVDVAFGDHRASFNSYGPESRSHVLAWHAGWYGALMSRDDASLEALSTISDDVMRASPSIADEYAFAWKAALLAFRSEPSSALPRVERAIELTAPEHIQVSNKFAAASQRATYAMLPALVRGDADQFRDALAHALEAHRKFWKPPTRKGQPLGWVAWGPLGLCCLARDRGMRVDVESEYLLPYLVERGWEQP